MLIPLYTTTIFDELTLQVIKDFLVAIDGTINLSIYTGHIYALIGENGAGKTTLMRVLTTVLKQTEGLVSLDGILYNEGNYEKIQKKIGYLPQEIDLYPNLTVKECLVYMGGLSGVARNDLEQRITYYLEKTSLTEHQNKKMRQLSGGMKRRVGLIQALLNNPDFLIIDEPTTGLDPEERIRIRNLLVDFSKDRTVLFSTHVVEDLAATCTQLAIMKKGSFLYSGSVSGLLENAKGCVWNCTVQNAEEARLLEANYSISSKQYVENGIHMKILSKGKPNEKCVPDNDITLEDAYIYLTNS
jgi:ABC-2 type transport system ATP-binding protein